MDRVESQSDAGTSSRPFDKVVAKNWFDGE